jgi:hypothetical protein
MSAQSVLSREQLAKIRELLHLGKQVTYVAQRLNIPRPHIIEAGFGDGLRYDPKADVMTARPAALDHDPEPKPELSPLTGHVRTHKPRGQTPAHLLPPKPPVVVVHDEPAPQEQEQPMRVVHEEPSADVEPSVAELMQQHGTTTAEVRRWAHAHRVFCPSHGSIPRDVFMQWLAAPVLESGTDRPEEQDTPGPWKVGDRVSLMLLGERVTGTVVVIFAGSARRFGVRPDRLIAGTDLVVAVADELEALPASEESAAKSANNIPAAVVPPEVKVEVEVDGIVESIDALLERVRLTDDPQVRTAARAVWRAAAVLDEALRRAVARADVTAAKQRLDEATAAAEAARMEYLRLAALTGANDPAGHAALGALAAADVRAQLAEHGTDSAAVRAWARDHGVDCPPTGTVPRRVLQAWLDAHHPNERTAQ